MYEIVHIPRTNASDTCLVKVFVLVTMFLALFVLICLILAKISEHEKSLHKLCRFHSFSNSYKIKLVLVN